MSVLFPFLQDVALPFVKSPCNDMPLSTLISSSLGFLCDTSSVGVSGDMGIAASGVSVIPRSWSATAFLGLLAPEEGGGLPRGGVDAERKAVLSKGTGGACSRFRLGDG